MYFQLCSRGHRPAALASDEITYDVESGKITRAAELPVQDGEQLLGGAVYRYDIDVDTFTTVVERGDFGSPQGLALDAAGENLYVADYLGGIYRVSLEDGSRTRLMLPESVTDHAINGARTLAANLDAFDEPTLGAVHGDDFYFVANSHWNRFDAERRLSDGLTGPIILKLSLTAP